MHLVFRSFSRLSFSRLYTINPKFHPDVLESDCKQIFQGLLSDNHVATQFAKVLISLKNVNLSRITQFFGETGLKEPIVPATQEWDDLLKLVQALDLVGILLEDLEASQITQLLRSPTQIFCPDYRQQVRMSLYGNRTLPIPLNHQFHTPNSMRRRQMIIECQQYVQHLEEYRQTKQHFSEDPLTSRRGTRLFRHWAQCLAQDLPHRSTPYLGELSLETDEVAVVSLRALVHLLLEPAKRDVEKLESRHGIRSTSMCSFTLVADKVGGALLTRARHKGDLPTFSASGENPPKVSRKRPLTQRILHYENQPHEDMEALAMVSPKVYQKKEIRIKVGSEVLASILNSCMVELPYDQARDLIAREDRETGVRTTEVFGPPVVRPTNDSTKRLRGDVDHRTIYGSMMSQGLAEIHAFRHGLVRSQKKTFGMFFIREVARQILTDDPIEHAPGFEDLALPPMIVLPQKWTSIKGSPYLYLKTKAIRWVGPQHMWQTYERANLHRIFRILEGLGEVPWRINIDVLQAQLLVLTNYDEPAFHRILPKAKSTFEGQVRMAQMFRHLPALYFPHNMDFRGRVYPLPQPLNHMGSDIARGLLCLVERVTLGERGLFWLQVQLANLYGKDKLPFHLRVAFIQEQAAFFEGLTDFESLLRKPNSLEFWVEAENPWQFLGAAIEYAQALRHPGGPELYESNMAVHMDGSCNGLQHYAALGLDLQGGRAVGLVPSETPADVYTDVLNVVQQKVQEDAENGHPLASFLLNHELLRRKTVKQTVMTICYGVTFVGAIDQVEKQVKDLLATKENAPSDTEVRRIASYLAKHILGSVDFLFKEASQIMRWLNEISLALTSQNQAVSWMSPMGLPIQQPYNGVSSFLVSTAVQTCSLRKFDEHKIDVRKQKIGFPPNFVHSLDASHLMMTAERMQKQGLVFAAVHDSYWTHAAHVDQMSQFLRETFIEMYSKPILKNLQFDTIQTLGGQCTLPEVPAAGQLRLSDVRSSPYFFN